MSDTAENLKIFFLGIFGGIAISIILFKVSSKEPIFRNTDSRKGSCIIQERVSEPEYRLFCEDVK